MFVKNHVIIELCCHNDYDGILGIMHWAMGINGSVGSVQL